MVIFKSLTYQNFPEYTTKVWQNLSSLDIDTTQRSIFLSEKEVRLRDGLSLSFFALHPNYLDAWKRLRKAWKLLLWRNLLLLFGIWVLCVSRNKSNLLNEFVLYLDDIWYSCTSLVVFSYRMSLPSRPSTCRTPTTIAWSSVKSLKSA